LWGNGEPSTCSSVKLAANAAIPGSNASAVTHTRHTTPILSFFIRRKAYSKRPHPANIRCCSMDEASSRSRAHFSQARDLARIGNGLRLAGDAQYRFQWQIHI
jgi:hypothetical protein